MATVNMPLPFFRPLLPFLILFFAAPSLLVGKDLDAIDHPLLSPDGFLEVYWLPEGVSNDVNGKPYDYGTKLFLRPKGSRRDGILLRENSRWMAVQWSPNSTLLGVEDHWDGHASEVYVYEITLSPDRKMMIERQVFHSPENAYDLKWFIEGWNVPKRMILLRREQRTNDGLDVPKSWKDHAAVEHAAFPLGL
jgi:hypothetical protein